LKFEKLNQGVLNLTKYTFWLLYFGGTGCDPVYQIYRKLEQKFKVKKTT
jgi:hypothetical protein